MENTNAKNLTKFLIFILIITVWTIIIPGVASYFNDTFYPDVVLKNLVDKDAKEKAERDNARRLELKTAVDSVKTRILEWTPEQKDSVVLADLISQKNELEESLTTFRNNVRVSGFADNYTTMVWWFNYFGLGILVFFLAPNKTKDKWNKNWGFVTMLVYLTFAWTNWYRTTPLGQYGRTVFSYVHFDVGVTTFFLQELRILGMCILVCIIWRYWCSSPNGVGVNSSSSSSNIEKLTDLSLDVSHQFRVWQRNSILLAVAFLPWTWFYWRSMGALADTRYIYSAVVLHLLWLGTWIIITTHLWNLAIVWKREKLFSLAKLLESDSKDSNNESVYIQGLDPLQKFQVGFAIITSLISFFSPFIELIV
jgi:hypothetical protein